MKIKCVQVVRPEIDVEYTKSVFGRLYLLYCLRMFFIKKVMMTVWVVDKQKFKKAIPVYYICVPKFHFSSKEV